jgi:hypothetical protein
MQAITTKYLGPTDKKGARIKATCDAGSITVSYPHELSGQDVHAFAAMALVRKLGWNIDRNTWECASLPGQAGCVFVWAGSCTATYTARFGELTETE